MNIVISTPTAAHIENESDFTRFAVISVSGPLQAGQALSCGVVDHDTSHVWIDPIWLAASGPADFVWQEGLQGMIAYAGKKGWLDNAGRIRAHIDARD